MIDANELIEFFGGEYDQEASADDVKKAVREELKSYAKNNEINFKALMSAYSLYKKYASGKNTEADLDDEAQLSGIVDDYFAKN